MPRRAQPLPALLPLDAAGGARWSSIGLELGTLCLAYLVATVDDMLALLRIQGHPIRALLFLVLGMRTRRTSHSRDNVILQLHNAVPRPWVMRLVQMTFTIYACIRAEAAPRAQQPVDQAVETGMVGFVSRRLRRYLRAVRGRGVQPEDRTSLKARAAERMSRLWSEMSTVHAVVWFDNFYRRVPSHDPTNLDQLLNCTVMAVLRLVGLPPWPGLPEVAQFETMLVAMGQRMHKHYDVMKRLVQSMQSLAIDASEIRVPLDIVRRA